MGRPDFGIIQLEVNYENGKPVSVQYWDQEGCGHSSATIPLNEKIEELTKYHLRHAKVSHEMEYPQPCPEKISVKGENNQYVNIRCSRDVHEDKKHAFEW